MEDEKFDQSLSVVGDARARNDEDPRWPPFTQIQTHTHTYICTQTHTHTHNTRPQVASRLLNDSYTQRCVSTYPFVEDDCRDSSLIRNTLSPRTTIRP